MPWASTQWPSQLYLNLHAHDFTSKYLSPSPNHAFANLIFRPQLILPGILQPRGGLRSISPTISFSFVHLPSLGITYIHMTYISWLISIITPDTIFNYFTLLSFHHTCLTCRTCSVPAPPGMAIESHRTEQTVVTLNESLTSNGDIVLPGCLLYLSGQLISYSLWKHFHTFFFTL